MSGPFDVRSAGLLIAVLKRILITGSLGGTMQICQAGFLYAGMK